MDQQYPVDKGFTLEEFVTALLWHLIEEMKHHAKGSDTRWYSNYTSLGYRAKMFVHA
jgi:hypothetical protein